MKWQPTSRKRKQKSRREQAKAPTTPGSHALRALLESKTAPPLTLAQAEFVAGLLGEAPTTASVLDAAEKTAEEGERVVRRQLQLLPPETEIACQAGCAWCCNIRVEVSVPEIARLVDHLRRTRSADQLARLQERVSKLAADPRVKSKEAKPEARLGCALLESNRCSVYEARPLACRGCTSFDAASCERSLDDPSESGEFYYPQLEAFMSLNLGMLRGLKARGLGIEILELTSGLSIALSDPSAIERWIAGEPVFDSARVDV